MNPERMNAIIEAAKEQLDTGVMYEPRAYVDVIVSDSGVEPIPAVGAIIPSQAQVRPLMNSEQFPVRITHVVASVVVDPTSSPTFLQRIGGRLRYNDRYYPNAGFLPLAGWQNKATALPSFLGASQATWVFDKPNILSAEDTLTVTASINADGLGDRTVYVHFHGFGLFSRRPYIISSHVFLDATNGAFTSDANTTTYRDDSSEPIALYQMVVSVTPGADVVTPFVGDLKQVVVQVKQRGNSSRAQWVGNLITPFTRTHAGMPGVLFGTDGGIAYVSDSRVSGQPTEVFLIEHRGDSAVALLQMECYVGSENTGRVLPSVLERKQTFDELSVYRAG